MINSMTGYGQAQGQLNNMTYVVEIRTVNNRYFKTNIKLPEAAAFLEEDIDRLLRESLSRGMVSFVLTLKDISENTLVDINEGVLQGYIKKLDKAASSTEVPCNMDISNLLLLPGVLSPATPGKEQAEEIKKAVLGIAEEALSKVKQMRSAEGAALASDLQDHCKQIKADLEQITSRRKVVLEQYREKLKKRVDELMAEARLELDEETLAREVAIFAERSDITEELTRLGSHLQQFTQSCQGNDQAGRRLDFISQEMLREANTIASKANDSETAKLVVDIKCRIDRIKEQVQNIE